MSQTSSEDDLEEGDLGSDGVSEHPDVSNSIILAPKS